MSEHERQLGLQAKIIFDEQGEDFDVTFKQWLRENWRIYLTFYSNAEEMRLRARREHYSARTIIELMRWHTDLIERDSTFKINNNAVPDMARMYNKMTNSNFFQERKQ